MIKCWVEPALGQAASAPVRVAAAEPVRAAAEPVAGQGEEPVAVRGRVGQGGQRP